MASKRRGTAGGGGETLLKGYSRGRGRTVTNGEGIPEGAYHREEENGADILEECPVRHEVA